MQLPLLPIQTAMIFDEYYFESDAPNRIVIPVRIEGAIEPERLVQAIDAEWRCQPVSRLRIMRDDFGMPTGQKLDGVPLAANGLSFSIERRGGDTVLHLHFHHALADRPGIEALLARAVARLDSGRPGAGEGFSDASYARSVEAILARIRPAAPAARGDRHAIGPGDPLAGPLLPSGATPLRAEALVPLDHWKSFVARAEAAGMSPNLALFAVVARALDTARAGRPSIIAIPVSLRDALPEAAILGSFMTMVEIATPQICPPDFDWREWARDAFAAALDRRWDTAAGEAAREPGEQRAPVEPSSPFDLLFAWHDRQDVIGRGFRIIPGIALPHPGHAPLALSVQPGAAGLDMALDCDPGRIDPAGARALLRLIADAIADRTTDPARLRGPELESPPDPLAAIREQAILRPGAPAMLDGMGGRLTYAELLTAADRIATHVAGLGAAPVVLYGKKAIPTFGALLGLLHGGRAFALCEADADALPGLCDAVGATDIVGDGNPVTSVGTWHEIAAILGGPAAAAPPVAQASTPTLVPVILFTSGTTGKPRPVVLDPGALAAHAHWAKVSFSLTADDKVLQFNAPGFDALLEELLPAWSVGATVVVADPVCTRSGADLLDFCARQGISVLNLPTGFFNLAWQSFGDSPWPEALRLIVIGGEAYTGQAVAGWLGRAHCRVRILTTYGPTEATVDVTAGELSGMEQPGLLGAPRPGVELCVVDRLGRPVEPGLAGELMIGGPSIARGYLGRGAETADRFVPDPAALGGRLYRTGDRVRMTEQGLEYCGRIDRQLKIAGKRLDPAPVEALIATACGGAQVRLVDSGGGSGLTAHVAAADRTESRSAIASALSGLPAWQRPNRVIFGVLPLTARGKIDELALRAGDGPPSSLPPGQESSGWQLLCELLAPQVPDPAAPFFASASRSLDVMRLVAGCRSRIGRSPSIQDLYLATTTAQVAAAIDQAPVWRAAPPAPADGLAASSGELALFVDQSRIAGASPYRIDTRWTLSAPLDPARLARAVDRLRRRHPLLGSRLALQGDRLVWEVEPGDAADRSFTADMHPDAAGNPELHLSASHLVCGGANLARAANELAALYRTDVETTAMAVPARAIADSEATAGGEADSAATDGAQLARLPPDLAATATGCAAIDAAAPTGIAADYLETRRSSAMALFAAGTSAWLARFLEVDAVIVPIAARLPESLEEEGIRLEVCTLPILSRPGAGQSLDALAGDIAEAMGQALHHAGPAASGLARLVRDAGGGLPILLDISDQRQAAILDFGATTARACADRVPTVRADIEISLIIADDSDLRVQLRGRDGSYGRDILDHWARSLACFLGAALSEPDRPLTAFPLGGTLDDGATPGFAAMLSPPAPPRAEGGPSRLRDCLGRIGAAVAFGDGHRLWSGAEMIAHADALAVHWHALGMQRGEPVCIRMERSADYPLALLTLWTAGAIPILLNPAHPPELLDAMELQAGARFRLIANGGQAGIGIEAIADGASRASSPPGRMPAVYGAFTSGSTGTPKLVLVDWAGFDRLLDWSRGALTLTPGDHFLHTAAAGFDIGLFEMWAPIVNGTPVCVAPPAAITDLGALVRLCTEQRITHLHLIPTLLAAFLDMTAAAGGMVLKAVMCGGEAVPVALQHRLIERGLALHHCYGPTEASVFALSWFSQGARHGHGALPLGDPIGGSAVAVVDALGWPTVRGAEGTLMLLGDCVARGYHGMPRATAERFQPFASPWRRAYDTGDRAVMRANGTIEFRGRHDRQVKIAGVRVEPLAVEAAMEAQQGVGRAIVVPVRRGEADGLAAIVVPVRRGEADGLAAIVLPLPTHAAADRPRFSATLIDAIRPSLPPAAVPGIVLVVDTLPTGPTGKIDYRAIDALVSSHINAARPAAADVEPESPTERILLDLWAGLLGPDNRHPDRNFFAAGGNSMTAIKLVGRLAAQGVVIGLGDCFRHPTPRRLARHVEAQHAPSGGTGAPAGTPAHLAPAAFHWLARQRQIDAAATILLALDFAAPLSPLHVNDVLHDIVLRHDGLRVRVMVNGPAWRTDFADAPAFASTAHDDPEEACRSARSQIDPSEGRLVGAALTNAGTTLVLAVHHLGADWHSLPIFAAIVRTGILGEQPLHEPPPFSRAAAHRLPDHIPIEDRLPHGKFGVASRRFSPVGTSAEHSARSIAAILDQALRQRGAASPRIAVECDGRSEDNATSIGWFTDFHIVGDDAGDSGRVAADAAINIVAAGAQAAGFHILADTMTPAHPLAIELALGDPASLTVLADESYSAEAREALAAAIARALTANDAAIDLPATSLQQMMLAGTIAYPGKGFYHSQIPIDIVGDWDTARLAAGWDSVVARFETLRLRYSIDRDGRIALHCTPPGAGNAIRIVHANDGIDEAFSALMTDDLLRPFAPGEPLSRVVVLRAADGDRILWSHHHVIADGWSLNVILLAWSRSYDELSGSSTPTGPGAQASLADYLRWLKTRECDVADLALGAHLCRLAPRIAVPPIFNPSDAAGSTRRMLDTSLSSAIGALSRRRAISEFEFYVAAWALLQARRTGRSAVGFHVVQSVRPALLGGIEHLAGLCMNQLPCLIDVSRDFDELLGAVRDTMAVMLDAQTASPESVARLLRETIRRTGFESQLIYENYPGDRGGVPLGPDARLVTRQSRERSFARHTLVVMPGETVEFELLHDHDPAETAESELLMDQFVAIISRLAAMSEAADA